MKKVVFSILKWLSVAILVLVVASVVFVNFAPVFGGKPTGDSLGKIQASKQFSGKQFINAVPTQVDTRNPQTSRGILESVMQMLFPAEGKNPHHALPSAKFSNTELADDSFVWLGHSTILMKTGGIVILTDPVFYNASPIPGTINPFRIEHPITISDLPDRIDVVLLSHDHYDHLDAKAIRELENRTDDFFVPLGLKAHLMKWGVAEDKITERDWHEVIDKKNVSFTLTPARHFSGRALTDRFSTLWTSWAIRSTALNIFFSGDSGYFDGFTEIGDNYGPFDIAFIENGAYDVDWSEIHMLPEQSVQANIDLQSKLMFPIHWGKFDLANHSWDEPIIRASRETDLRNVEVATPLVGEVFTLENIPHEKWWETVRSRSNE